MLKFLAAASGLMVMAVSQAAVATPVIYMDTTPRDSANTPIALPLTINAGPAASGQTLATGTLIWQQDLNKDGWTAGATVTAITLDISVTDSGSKNGNKDNQESLNFRFEGNLDARTLNNIPNSGSDWNYAITLPAVFVGLQADGIFNVQIDWSADPNTTAFILSGSTLTVTADVPAVVPEPASMALLGAGLLGIGAARRRSRIA